MAQLRVLKGDITQLQVDVIVNAANSSLLGGGGVDGAIHRAAGKELLDACRMLNGCKPGKAKITPGYKLTAKHIIHTVGPIWNGGKNKEPQVLYDCYFNSLLLFKETGLSSIAFPNISTGVYRFPKKLAAETALAAINDFYTQHPSALNEVVITCFDDDNYSIYSELLHLPTGTDHTSLPLSINHE